MPSPIPQIDTDVLTVVDLVRRGRASTRQQLAQMTGMGRNTISSLLNTAVALGLIAPNGSGPSTGGRAPATWRFRQEDGLVLVAGVHSSTLRLAVTDLGGAPVECRTLPWSITRGPAPTLAEAAARLRDMVGPLDRPVWAAGASLPGPIDQESGRPTAPPIMPGWDGFDVVAVMEEALGVPAVTSNDVNTMLLGHAVTLQDQAHRRPRDILYLQVGTGIGAGLMSNGLLHRGADGAAGDIGHVRVTGNDAVVCRCGRTGCLEAVAGGVAESGRAEASRRTALSGPRATARLLAVLPPVGLLLGAAVGARPEEVLLDGGLGSVLGAAGICLMIVGHRATARMVSAATASSSGVDEALVLDLAAAALACGASLPGALRALGEALDEEELAVAGRALLLGADWEEAWGAPDDEAWRERRSRLEGCLRPGWEDGASPAPLLEGTAASLRAGRRAADEEAAERLAVRLVLPLGLCHLPAFIVLGIAPVVMSVGLDLLGG